MDECRVPLYLTEQEHLSWIVDAPRVPIGPMSTVVGCGREFLGARRILWIRKSAGPNLHSM